MHEMSITHSLLDLVLDHTSRTGAHRVKCVHVAIGELSNVADEPMRLYWEILSTGTAAEGADLQFREVPVQLECRDCATRFKPQHHGFRCALCSGGRLRVVAGKNLQLEAIDVDPS